MSFKHDLNVVEMLQKSQVKKDTKDVEIVTDWEKSKARIKIIEKHEFENCLKEAWSGGIKLDFKKKFSKKKPYIKQQTRKTLSYRLRETDAL